MHLQILKEKCIFKYVNILSFDSSEGIKVIESGLEKLPYILIEPIS